MATETATSSLHVWQSGQPNLSVSTVAIESQYNNSPGSRMVATSGTVVNGLPHEDPPEVRINGATARKLNARNSHEHVDAHQRHQANGASGARAGTQGSRKSPKSRDKRKAECKHIVSSVVKEPDLLPADREARLTEDIAKMYHVCVFRCLYAESAAIR